MGRAIQLDGDLANAEVPELPNSHLPAAESAERKALAEAFEAGRKKAREEMAQLGHIQPGHHPGPFGMTMSYVTNMTMPYGSHYYTGSSW
jgi:hypothetical protein